MVEGIKVPVVKKQRRDQILKVINTNFFMPARDEGRIPSLASKHKPKSKPTFRKLKNPEAVQPALWAVFDVVPPESFPQTPNPAVPAEVEIREAIMGSRVEMPFPVDKRPPQPSLGKKKDIRKLSELL